MKKIGILLGIIFAALTISTATGYTKRALNIFDRGTGAQVVMDYAHHEAHEGDHFFVTYSVADLGAATTPDDMMTLSFTTPNTTKLLHFLFTANSASGGLFKLIESKTGGGATPTGLIQAYNSYRDSTNTSTILDVTGDSASQINYDATAFTGGTELVSNYIGAKGVGTAFSGGESRGDQEIILKANTQYQVSIYNTAAVPGTIQLSWYEHTF